MELQQYLQILRRHWRSTLATIFVCIALAAGFTLLQKPTYESTASVFFSVNSGGTAGELANGATYAERTVTSYVKVATTAMVLDSVIKDLGLSQSVEDLAKELTITSPTSTSIVNITATAGEPQQAAALASAVSKSLLTTVEKLSPSGAGATPLVQATIIDDATPPTGPSAPRPAQNLAIGALLGLILGFGQAILRNVLDTRVRSTDDLSLITEAPILATIGHRPDPNDRGAAAAEAVLAEDYRRLRTNIGFVGLGGERRSSMVVTSSVPGEGKTETTVNLARMLSQAGERVLLVDADLRRPQVAARMRLDDSLGLSDVLTGRGRLEDLIIGVGPGSLNVLPAGTVPPNPSELLGSSAMARLITALEDRYDYVLFDSPPLLPVTDAVILAAKTGGAVVVVRSGKPTKTQAEHAFALLDSGEVTTLGVVLNDVSSHAAGGYESRYDSSTYASQPRAASDPAPARS